MTEAQHIKLLAEALIDPIPTPPARPPEPVYSASAIDRGRDNLPIGFNSDAFKLQPEDPLVFLGKEIISTAIANPSYALAMAPMAWRVLKATAPVLPYVGLGLCAFRDIAIKNSYKNAAKLSAGSTWPTVPPHPAIFLLGFWFPCWMLWYDGKEAITFWIAIFMIVILFLMTFFTWKRRRYVFEQIEIRKEAEARAKQFHKDRLAAEKAKLAAKKRIQGLRVLRHQWLLYWRKRYFLNVVSEKGKEIDNYLIYSRCHKRLKLPSWEEWIEWENKPKHQLDYE